MLQKLFLKSQIKIVASLVSFKDPLGLGFSWTVSQLLITTRTFLWWYGTFVDIKVD